MMARIDLGHSHANVTGTKPQRLRLGDWYCEPVSWADAMARVARALLDSIRFRDKLLKNIYSVSGIGAVSAAMRRPVKLEKNLWLEANKSAQDCLRTIAALLKAAEFPLDTAAVEYEEAPRKEEEASEKVPPLTNDVVATPSSPSSEVEEPYSKGDSVTQPSSSVSKLSEEAFVRYVAEASTDNNARKCRTGIRKISRILADMGLVKSSIFEIEDMDELQSAATALRANAEYLTEDKRSNGWLKSPLNHYLRFAETVLGKKREMSLGNDLKTQLNSETLSQQPAQGGDNLAETWKMETELRRFIDDIREHWPEGFDFSDGAIRLLESRCGELPRGMEHKLKAVMFHPRGKLWFVPDAVAPLEAQETIVAEARRLVDEWGFASLPLLSKPLDTPECVLRDEAARQAFVRFLLDSEFEFAGSGSQEMVNREGVDMDTIELDFTAQVRKFIEEHGGYAAIDDILETFPNLNEDALLLEMHMLEPEAIPEKDDDGRISFKMLSEYYLPDDFAETIRAIVADCDMKNEVPSAASFASALSERYDCDFPTDYALDSAHALKWAVDAAWRENKGEPLLYWGDGVDRRIWHGTGARAKFVAASRNESDKTDAPPQDRLDLPTQVETVFSGVFTNEDFWGYSTKTYGLARTREAKIAQLGHIAPRFIRLDRDRWISTKCFTESARWDAAKAAKMADILRDVLGSAPMVPMATLGATTFDALPEIPYRWTPELAASVAALLCPGVLIANHGAAPFAVTTLLVPHPVPPTEILPYVLRVYVARNPHGRSVEGAFEFLKENNIRFRLTNGLRSQIEKCLASEGEC